MHKCVGTPKRMTYSTAELDKTADFLKLFCDKTRLRIMSVLFGKSLAVCDIALSAEISHSLASHQLSAMRSAGLVKSLKQGKNVYYELDDECVGEILSMAVKHSTHKTEDLTSRAEGLE